jgi:hypothetical protein
MSRYSKKHTRQNNKSKTRRNINMDISEHEKKLIDALRSIEDLEDFNAHHFGDTFVDEKIRNYGRNFSKNYKNIFKNTKVFSDVKIHKKYLDKDGNLIIEDENGRRVIPPPKLSINPNNDFNDFKEKMRQRASKNSQSFQETYSKRVKDDGNIRTIYINENGKETKYTEPSQFKTTNSNHREFFNSESSFKKHKTSKSSSYSREEYDDGETLTITEIIDGEKRVSYKPSKLKKMFNNNSNQHKYRHKTRRRQRHRYSKSNSKHRTKQRHRSKHRRKHRSTP